MEIAEKKSRSLALKTKATDIESSEESLDECSDTENLNLLTRRFQKFIKKKARWRISRGKSITRNLILIRLNSPVLVVVNRVI